MHNFFFVDNIYILVDNIYILVDNIYILEVQEMLLTYKNLVADFLNTLLPNAMALPRSGSSNTKRFVNLTCCDRCGKKGWKQHMDRNGFCQHCVEATKPGLVATAATQRKIDALIAECNAIRRTQKEKIARTKEFAIADARQIDARAAADAQTAAQKAEMLARASRIATQEKEWTINHDFAPEMRRQEQALEKYLSKRFDTAMVKIRSAQRNMARMHQTQLRRSTVVESVRFHVDEKV